MQLASINEHLQEFGRRVLIQHCQNGGPHHGLYFLAVRNTLYFLFNLVDIIVRAIQGVFGTSSSMARLTWCVDTAPLAYLLPHLSWRRPPAYGRSTERLRAYPRVVCSRSKGGDVTQAS